MSCQFISHNGKQILYCDYRGMENEEEMLDNLELEARMVKGVQGKALILADFRDSTVGTGFMNRAKELGKILLNEKTEKSAVLGITGMKAILLKAYNSFSGDKLTPFGKQEEALEYLVS